ncbi:MAG: leucyl aminopeptidase [Chloroflexi bacterium]|nr:leucyl aminopeptidase [Chloroflexota bacterium]
MEIKVVSGDITQVDAAAVVVNLFEGVQTPGGATGAADRALDGAISRLIAEGEIKGKKGEVTIIHTLGRIPPARVVVAGLGKQKDFSNEVVRQVMGTTCRRLRGAGVEKVATILHGAGIGGLDTGESAQAVAEGALLGLYTFKRHFTKTEDVEKEVKELTVVEMDAARLSTIQEALDRGRVFAEAAMLARDMVNEPSNFMTPTHIADIARQVAQEHHLEATILDRPQMEELGMGGLLGVARGSAEPPKFIVLRYWGDPGNPGNNLGLLGKGITFDTGGISLKPAAGMEEMKGDMAGAASVLSAMKAIAQLKPRINVTAIAAATENMPGGSAQKPGDVLRTMGGKTVEVENTDAEGRLVLADALGYARKMGLRRLVDVATLTGAMVTALGDICTGAFTNNLELLKSVISAGETSGEHIWQFPMYEEYKEQNKSQVADVKNTGGRKAGSITAAQFLAEFSEDTPWVHLDIAGTSMADKESGYLVKGATGVPVRTLINLALGLAER